MKLQPDDGRGSSLGIGPGSDDAMGSRRSSLRDSPKGSGSSLGTRQEIVGRRPEDSPQECQRLPDWREFERCSGISAKFARRFAKEIGKLVGNMPGDHQKKTEMSEAIGLAGVYCRCIDFWVADPPRLGG
ncbi:hypothetical protein GW17_00040987 [Ensete ventricosum]|nr:hypothetical protein GW17_00040987 [Ensete ventricosum]